MYQNKTILAIITARGGSKGIPHKNIKSLLGKPLIVWTIEAAKKSRYVDQIIVSTDDARIAKIAKKYGADIPFLRPKRLAGDKTKSIDVVLHVIDELEKNNKYYDLILLLQPTSPLRLPEDIDKAIKLLFLKDAKAIISVCRVDCCPDWINTLPSSGSMVNFIRPRFIDKNRQQLPKFYKANGAIFLAYSDYLKARKNFLGYKNYAYIMPKERSIDIDDKLDFEFAKFLLNKKV